MRIPAQLEVLSIGDELLDGRVADTNTVRLAKALEPFGTQIRWRQTVTDDIDAIIAAAEAVVARGTALCVVCGGLGPTTDDLTAEAFAQWAGSSLVRDADQVERIREFVRRRGRPLSDSQLRQAEIPAAAVPIANPAGMACGFALDHQGCRFVALPGVPWEFDAMVEAALVAPERAEREAAGEKNRQLVAWLLTFGLPEAAIDERLNGLPKRFPKVRLGYRVKFPGIHVSLKADTAHRDDLEAARAFVREVLGDHIYTEDPEKSLAMVVLERLRQRGWRLGLAESCTGGLIGDVLTDVPGSSDVFAGGVQVYSNGLKEALLGVPPDVLASSGAVSEDTVRAMVRGARARLGTEAAVAVSGIAGPGGGTEEKPVGTVWIAAATPDELRTHRLQLPFERRKNKMVAAYSALHLIWLMTRS